LEVVSDESAFVSRAWTPEAIIALLAALGAAGQQSSRNMTQRLSGSLVPLAWQLRPLWYQFGVDGSTPIASVCRLSHRDRRLWLLREMTLEGAHAGAVTPKRLLGHISYSGIDFRMSAE
jgi:hypothetical protein